MSDEMKSSPPDSVNELRLTSGRVIRCNRGILGLSVLREFDTIFGGYDEIIHEEGSEDPLSPPFSPEEREEIAQIMVSNWSRWGGLDPGVPVLLGGQNTHAWMEWMAKLERKEKNQ